MNRKNVLNSVSNVLVVTLVIGLVYTLGVTPVYSAASCKDDHTGACTQDALNECSIDCGPACGIAVTQVYSIVRCLSTSLPKNKECESNGSADCVETQGCYPDNLRDCVNPSGEQICKPTGSTFVTPTDTSRSTDPGCQPS